MTPTPCAVCGKATNRRARLLPDGAGLARVCSDACADYHLTRTKPMVDPTESETEAMAYAGAMGGEYLDHLGKTDLAKLSLEEWQEFLRAICGGYTEKLLEAAQQAYSVSKVLRAKVTASDIPY